MASDAITYDKAELRSILRAFKAMDEEAVAQAKEVSNKLATEVLGQIQSAASEPAQQRIAQGGKVSKSSKVGEVSFGFASQRYSGGGTTKQLWPGFEFGSDRLPQFAPWSGRYGGGSRGKFIYPTLRSMQRDIITRWQEAFSKIVRKW